MGNTTTSLTVDAQTQVLTELLLIESIQIIDSTFGFGYSKEHPETLASFLQAYSTNFQTSKISSLLEEKLQNITGRLDIILDYIEK